jgi:methionine biosynthesis protein MetW
MSVVAFENKRWARDDQEVSFRHREALALISGITDSSNQTLLDIGCGDGLLLSLVKEKGIEAKGLDISEKGAEKARAKGLEVVVTDIGDRIPFPDNTFDIVTALDVLEHLYAPEELLNEATRVSKRWIIVSVPNFNSVAARMQVLLGAVPENNHPHKGHVYWFNESVLKAMVRKEHLFLRSMRVNTLFENILILGTIFALLAQAAPSLFALSFVVQLEKDPKSP